VLDGIVLVGAGRTADSLLPRLAALAPLTVIDTTEAALTALRSHADVDASRITLLVADGTSRMVLQDLKGTTGELGLVAATGSDRHNLEACRLATELGFSPVVGIVIDAATAPAYEAAGVRSVIRASLLGEVVERALRFDGLAIATTVGQGRGEIIEFVVLPGSPAVGASLAELHAEGWRIAAIYRSGKLVLPTGATKIDAEDRVLLVGDADLLPVVAEQLRVGRPMFPMPYGKNIVAYLPQGRDATLEAEAQALTVTTRAQALVRTWPQAPASSTRLEPTIPGKRPKQLRDVPLTGASLAEHLAGFRAAFAGVIATRLPARTAWQTILGRGGPAADLCNAAEIPVMFLRGDGAYQRVVHPLLSDAIDERVAFAALDLARMFSLPLKILRVEMPAYFGSQSEPLERILASLERRLRLYGVSFEVVTLTGNPVHRIVAYTQPTDLVVVGRRATDQDGFSSPDVAIRIAQRTRASVLVRTLRSA